MCVCVCVCLSAAILRFSSWQPSPIGRLLAVKPARRLARQYAWYSAHKLPLEAGVGRWVLHFLMQLYMHAQIYSHIDGTARTYTHTHTFCLSVSDVVFSTWLHSHSPIIPTSAAQKFSASHWTFSLTLLCLKHTHIVIWNENIGMIEDVKLSPPWAQVA